MLKPISVYRQNARRPPSGARAIRYVLKQLGYDITFDDAELVAYYAEPLIGLVLNNVYPLPSRPAKKPSPSASSSTKRA